VLLTTLWTATLAASTILDVLLQRALNTVLPCVDGLRVEVQAVNKLNNLVNRHAVAQYARDKLRIVPELLVEES
jgi:hypothetical protein